MFFYGFVLGILFVSPCVFFYFLVIKGVDRFEPEPWWLLIAMFFWGALVATTAAIIVSILGENAMALATGSSSADPIMDATAATFIAPLTEESSKFLGLLLLWALSAFWLKELDGPLDGVIYGEESLSANADEMWGNGWPLFCRDAGIAPETIDGDRKNLSLYEARAWKHWSQTKLVEGFNILYDYTKLESTVFPLRSHI